jgi:hypothetical protein
VAINREFRLYRLTHPDGTANEWAVAYLGDGRAETRWGEAHRLSNVLVTTVAVAMNREQAYELRGYRYMGRVRFVSQGRYILVQTPPPLPQKPIDVATLLGGDDAPDFYF